MDYLVKDKSKVEKIYDYEIIYVPYLILCVFLSITSYILQINLYVVKNVFDNNMNTIDNSAIIAFIVLFLVNTVIYAFQLGLSN